MKSQLRALLLVGATLCFWCYATTGADVTVAGGTLTVGAKLEAARVLISPMATLAGGGLIQGNVEIGGRLAPSDRQGQRVGTLAIIGNAKFLPGGSFFCDVTNHTALDQLHVTGKVEGSCLMSFAATPGAVPVGQVVVRGNAASQYQDFRPTDQWTWRLDPTGSLNLAVTHLRGDSDADGLPDWWEMRFFGGSRTAGEPGKDTDGDGMYNREEYIANTDPTSTGSLFRVTRIVLPQTNMIAIGWTTTAGRRYTIQEVEKLVGGQWTNRTELTTYNMPEHVWTNFGPAGQTKFYRVTVSENMP